jgi:hypothetical protein
MAAQQSSKPFGGTAMKAVLAKTIREPSCAFHRSGDEVYIVTEQNDALARHLIYVRVANTSRSFVVFENETPGMHFKPRGLTNAEVSSLNNFGHVRGVIDCLQAMSIGISNECGIIVGMILSSKPGRRVVNSARAERRSIESFHRLAIWCQKAEMGSPRGFDSLRLCSDGELDSKLSGTAAVI